MITIRCINYVGVICVNGSCPNALANEYPEYGYEHCDCKECGYYKGCTDCALYWTDMCTPINEKGEIMEVKTINIKYVKEGMDKIEILSGGDWIDLRIAEDVTLEAGEFKLIPLGVAMVLPKGYEALVIPRSSTFKKYGIIQANSVGLIDETYCGNNDEWHFPAYATRNINIPKNTRICQFRIIEHQPSVGIVEVTELSEVNRGGFGSTGEK